MFEPIKWLWNKIFEDRKVIWEARISVIFLLVIFVLGTWGVARVYYSDQMDMLEKENTYLKTQLKGQLPEQAAKQISDLQNEVNLIQKQSLPWQINQKEKSKLVAILKVGTFSIPKAPKFKIKCSGQSSFDYCEEWNMVLLKSGWIPNGGMDKAALTVPPVRGISIEVQHAGVVGAIRLQEAFKYLGIKAESKLNANFKDDRIQINIGKKG